MEEILYIAAGSILGALVAPKIRPVLVGVMTAGYKVADVVCEKTSGQRKNVEGLFGRWRKDLSALATEAKERARCKCESTETTAKA